MAQDFNESIMELLIRYADNDVSAEEKAMMQDKLQQDESLRERYNNILLAKEAVSSAGLADKVKELHQKYYNAANESNKAAEGKIKELPRTGNISALLRIAAVFFIAVAGYGIFRYSATGNDSFYNKNYIAYSLPSLRGENNTDDKMDSLYRAGQYNEALSLFTSLQTPSPENYFIAGLSYLNMNNAPSAIAAFEKLQQVNAASPEKHFEQEAEYYLALAYIKAGRIDDAEKLLTKIKSDKQHLYYAKVNEMSALDLMILRMKN